jgi:uncharacterized membrane protein (UPF0127 family)
VVSNPVGSTVADELIEELPLRAARGVVALARTDGSTICERCVVADRMLPRMRGLLGKRGLPPGEGLLIRPARSIHTFFMRFAIDAVFLAGDGRVLKVAENVKPWRARSCRKAYAVLELPAGEAGRRGISADDWLVVTARGQ